MGFNVSPTGGIAGAADTVNETFTAKSYMEGVLNELATANASTPPSVILNCYQFLNAMENSQSFNVTMSPTGQPLQSPSQTFNFNFLTPDEQATLKTESQTLFSTYAEMVQDPNSNNNYDIQLQDQTTGKPATLLDLLQNSSDTFTVEADCHGSIDNPDWAPNLDDHYSDSSWFSAGGLGHDGSDFSGANGIQVSSYDVSSYHGGGTDFTATGSGSDWAQFARIQPSAGTAAAESTLAAFLDKNM